MARITVEDCLDNQSNRFVLVRLASRRAKQLLSGKTAVVDTKGNKAVVSALREIAGGKVRFNANDPKPSILAPRSATSVAAPAAESVEDKPANGSDA